MDYRIKSAIKLIFFTIVLIISFFFIKNNLFLFKKILDLKFYQFIILSIMTFTEFILTGLLFKTMLQFFNIKLKYKEWFGLTIINRFYNYLFIKGGPFIRSIYLKKNYNFSYKNFILLFVFASIIQVFCISLMSSLSLLFNYYNNIFNTSLFSFSVIITIASAAILFLPNKVFNFLIIKYEKTRIAIEILIKIKESKKLLFKSIFLIISTILLFSFKIFYIYNIIFEPILFSSAIIIASMGMLSFFISLTPASIGIREAAMSYAASLTGESFASGVIVASLDRAIIMFWVFLLGSVFSIWLSKKISKDINNN